ncbi:MAG: GNAT family N-acetyltransferase [Gammaproteobacteria bacterium]|nr:GNAT family N-acetyltransferase [Gammaproteobacteria bacterium]NIR99031.1 GNAT family N-acetyltransferase [Gammaproteobacteria bacterium]NIT64657.1 GNAT family N-acetyltransferase [Gammaproteobacteria bacterium]NIV21630.1 GNAT family N-acetyltransferase [Gammaproteobacteria bacterium]NIY33237.1 GNAT family N-acetyltransferase [Gammaproteobacteria bacterium]
MNKVITMMPLADYPQFVPVIASWVFDHWGKMYRMTSVDEQIGKISERLNKDRFPMAFVAMKGPEPVGTASLKIQEMTTHKHLYHWLGTVYVVPGCRKMGIGTALVRQAEMKAKELGVESLYLHTPDMERFYAKRGWVAIDGPVYFDMPVVVMEKVLII